MRYPASEKAEIIKLVEQSHLPAKRTLDKLGIPRATFYRWYDRYRESGVGALADHRSRPDRVWNRIPDDVRGQIIDLALELPELSPASWPCASPTNGSTLSPRLRSTGC
jgi:putative transposase